jgi:hypothetical protein
MHLSVWQIDLGLAIQAHCGASGWSGNPGKLPPRIVASRFDADASATDERELNKPPEQAGHAEMARRRVPAFKERWLQRRSLGDQ